VSVTEIRIALGYPSVAMLLKDSYKLIGSFRRFVMSSEMRGRASAMCCECVQCSAVRATWSYKLYSAHASHAKLNFSNSHAQQIFFSSIHPRPRTLPCRSLFLLSFLKSLYRLNQTFDHATFIPFTLNIHCNSLHQLFLVYRPIYTLSQLTIFYRP